MLITSEAKRQRLLQDELWYRGELRYLIAGKRPHGQLQAYDRIKAWKRENPKHPGPIVLLTYRRFGKSFLDAIHAAETALRTPGACVKVGAGWYKQIRDIFRPVWNKVLRACPGALQPDPSGYTYTFRNPRWREPGATSEVTLVGCNIEHGDRLRGTDLDFCSLDEARDINELIYVIQDVLWPQFLRREAPLLVLSSTMPKTLAHDFIELKNRARREGRLIDFRVANLDRDPMVPPEPEENLDWSHEDEWLVLAGGITKDSPTWRREFMNEEVPDLEALIIPEWFHVGEKSTFTKDYTDRHEGRPRHFFAYMGCDLGWDDQTAILHGFHDFDQDLLVIEAEIVRNRTTPKEIAQLIKDREEELYPGAYARRQIQRYSDNDKLTLASLTQDHDVWVWPAEKHDKLEAIAQLRTRVGAGKLRVHKRCKELIYQLKNGIWDERRKEFIRTKTLGHCDAIDALIYLNRMINVRANPGPVMGKPEDPNVFTPPWVTSMDQVVTNQSRITRFHSGRGPSPFG